MTTEEHNARFTAWLARHGAVLHHVANAFAAGTDRHDLMQELLLAMWRAVPAFREGAQPSTFIFRVAHNTALTWHRTQRNYRRRVEGFEAFTAIDSAPASESAARERETLAQVYAAIRELPPLDRSLMLLHLDGVSYAGIADIHGLTESNVGVRLNRLKQKLTESMKGIVHELR